MVCQHAWELLGFEKLLKKLHMSQVDIAATRAVLFGRMISPGSEAHTIKWFRTHTALNEFPNMELIKDRGNDLFYEVGDRLYRRKDKIEMLLYQKEQELFPETETTIYLYDMTNTYLEGSALANDLAQRGHCKSKRNDCPLLALSLVVRNDGIPVCSRIYKGNMSEPLTMQEMMTSLMSAKNGIQTSLFKMTVVMDRGMATAKNIEWLRNNGFHYIVIKRGDGCKEYKETFENWKDTFTCVRSQESVYGEENAVYFRREHVDDATCRVLCVSEGKAKKEKAIQAGRDKTFREAIRNLHCSIEKGTIKQPKKIEDKFYRILGKYPSAASNYHSTLVKVGEQIYGIQLARKAVEVTTFGSYVIESSRVELSGEILWNLYMTLTRVESAFRSMKESLGFRPIYHQTADRSAAHLFIAVLAYHMLAAIEFLLHQHNDTRTWESIRFTLSTMMRGTVHMRDHNGSIYYIRISDDLEDAHKDIFDKLNLNPFLKPVISQI
jgi:transposase